MKRLWRASIDFTKRFSSATWQDQGLLNLIQGRLFFTSGAFIVAFSLIAIRLGDVMVVRGMGEIVAALPTPHEEFRGDILDRNHSVLATYLVTGSVYANPRQILNSEEAVRKLRTILSELDAEKLMKRLNSTRQFVWVARHISPKIQDAIHRLGIPGIYLMRDKHRVYPYGRLVSHVLGYVGVDGDGLAGVERFFDERLKANPEPLHLSLDVRVQYIVHAELSSAMTKFSARAGNAMVMDMRSGEIIAMVSLPDYDPNLPNENDINTTFNRNTLGLYEPGSTFKILNTATALETGTSKLTTVYDARFPLQIGRFKITDFKGKNRFLTFKEAFLYSSNIANAKAALVFGGDVQREFFHRYGIFSKPTLELPEISQPIEPKLWPKARVITASYGYGISVSPYQILLSVASIIKGHTTQGTLLKQKEGYYQQGKRIISSSTSRSLRDLMRLVVTEGTAKKANVKGYNVIGKTGSAHIIKGRGYAKHSKLTTFIGAFPYIETTESSQDKEVDYPRYILVVMLDDPQPLKETYGYSTGGWNTAPIAGRIIERIAPLLRVTPVDQEESENHLTQEIVAIKHVNHHIQDSE